MKIMKGTSLKDMYSYDTFSLNSYCNEKLFRQNWRENQNTHFVCSYLFPLENRVLHDIMWIKWCRAGQATDVNKTRHMGIACWVTKATNTHSEYMMFIAFHYNNGCTNTPKYYVLLLLPISCGTVPLRWVWVSFGRTLENSATFSLNAILP
jgi:hypothetical protein